MLQRYAPPHKLDQAPKGTKLRVDQGDTFDMYIQISENEEDPKWDLLGNFTEESYQFYLRSHE
jgi:hypothetical protein